MYVQRFNSLKDYGDHVWVIYELSGHLSQVVQFLSEVIMGDYLNKSYGQVSEFDSPLRWWERLFLAILKRLHRRHYHK